VMGVMAYYGHADDPVRGADVRRRYVATMADAVVRLAESGCRIVLVGGDRVDVDVAREVRTAVRAMRPDLADDAVALSECTRFAELTEQMSRAEVVVASRFHNLVCALRLARPPVSVGYAGKNHHLMRAMGLESYIQVIDEVDADRLVQQVQSARQAQAELAGQIQAVTAAYPDQIRAVLGQVAVGTLGLEPSPTENRQLNEVGAWPRT
jgi:polysaccharide pyruvyl transferase WcaK-like protein